MKDNQQIREQLYPQVQSQTIFGAQDSFRKNNV
jgi:hypothetical protein